MLEQTKKFCDSFLDIGLPGFDLAVYQRGTCILRHHNGYRDLENKIPMNGTERYNIYSCTKLFTCVAAMQLWEQGLFSLEDPLWKYLPEFKEMQVQTEEGLKPAQNPILIKHLFEMTAGFSYNTSSPSLLLCREETNGRCPTREAMKYLAREPLQFVPGDRWNYSLCHDVLAALVEVLSGKKFEDYVQTHIFDVVGMKDSTLMLPTEDLETIAPQYNFSEGKAKNIGKEIYTFKIGTEYASGGAGGISTVDDYIRFLEALRTGRLLRPETVRLMATDRLTEYQKRTFWNKDTHGYGLGVRCHKQGGLLADFGWGGAAGAFLSIDLEHELSIYFAAHCTTSPSRGLRHFIYRMVRAELLDPADLPALQKELQEGHKYNMIY